MALFCGCVLGVCAGNGRRACTLPYTTQPRRLDHHTTHIHIHMYTRANRLPTSSTSSNSTETPAPKLVLQPPPPAPASYAPAPAHMDAVDEKEATPAPAAASAAPTAMEGVTTSQQRVTGEAARAAEAEATGEAGSEEEDFVAAELEVEDGVLGFCVCLSVISDSPQNTDCRYIVLASRLSVSSFVSVS